MGKAHTQYAKKKDGNHNEIAAALTAAGWHVTDLFRVGRGFPDMLAARQRVAILVEAKMPGEKLTPAELEYLEIYPGPRVIAHSAQEAVNGCAEIYNAIVAPTKELWQGLLKMKRER